MFSSHLAPFCCPDVAGYAVARQAGVEYLAANSQIIENFIRGSAFGKNRKGKPLQSAVLKRLDSTDDNRIKINAFQLALGIKGARRNDAFPDFRRAPYCLIVIRMEEKVAKPIKNRRVIVDLNRLQDGRTMADENASAGVDTITRKILNP